MRAPSLVLLLLSAAALRVLACAYHASPETTKTHIERRDSPNGRCGPQFSNFQCTGGANKKCCSQFGWCGDSDDHCGTGCQKAFGVCNPSAPEPVLPPIGPRPKLGGVAYGSNVVSCTTDNTIALTFDDGPWEYTTGLLDILNANGIKATFFVSGNNLAKGGIDVSPVWRAVIERMYNEGHQIGSHTWRHLDLNSVSENTRRYEMIRNEQAFLSILKKYPTYMRPPYIKCNSACLSTMGALGYHVIIWDLDTDDYNNSNPGLIQNSKDRVRVALAEKRDSYLSISHDIHWQTVYNLTAYQIAAGQAAGYKHVTLGECLSDPPQNWYRTAL